MKSNQPLLSDSRAICLCVSSRFILFPVPVPAPVKLNLDLIHHWKG